MRRYNRLRRWASGSEPVTSWKIALVLVDLILLQTLPEVPEDLKRLPVVAVTAWDLAVVSLYFPWRVILSGLQSGRPVIAAPVHDGHSEAVHKRS
jgi:hypothetical protein